MFARRIVEPDILGVVRHGESVEEYPDDAPYPSRLLLGWCNDLPQHVVVAHDPDSGLCIVITAYIPDAMHWGADFKTRI